MTGDKRTEMLGKVVLVVPTYNRPQFVHRTLSYHAKSDGLQIAFGDGSDPEYLAENKRIIASFSGSGLDIIHYTPEVPSFVKPALKGPYGLIERMVNSGRLSSRSFVNICGDDDFVSPEFLAEAATFLTANGDFSAAIGYHWSFHLDAPGAVGRVVKEDLSHSHPKTRAELGAAARIGTYEIQGENALDFAFFRRSTYEAFGEPLLQLACKAQDQADPTSPRITAFTLLYLQNLISDHICLALGKVLWLPRLQLGRHFHDANYGGYVRTVLKVNLGDSWVAPQWPALTSIYLDAVTNALVHSEKLDHPAARRIAEGGLALRAGQRLAYVGRQRFAEAGVGPGELADTGAMRRRLRAIPGVRNLVRALRGASKARQSRPDDMPSDVRTLKTFLGNYR